MPDEDKLQIRPKTTTFDGGKARDGTGLQGGGYGAGEESQGRKKAMGASGPDPPRFGTAQPEISESNLNRKFPVGRNIPIG